VPAVSRRQRTPDSGAGAVFDNWPCSDVPFGGTVAATPRLDERSGSDQATTDKERSGRTHRSTVSLSPGEYLASSLVRRTKEPALPSHRWTITGTSTTIPKAIASPALCRTIRRSCAGVKRPPRFKNRPKGSGLTVSQQPNTSAATPRTPRISRIRQCPCGLGSGPSERLTKTFSICRILDAHLWR